MFRNAAIFFLILMLCPGARTLAGILENDDVQEFIEGMSDRHAFDKNRLRDVFRDVQVSDKVLEAISRPAEALPWYKYRPIFMRRDRIRLGVDFMNENMKLLERAESEYGVPVEIITAILGVETRYGGYKGGYKVIDSLSTLAFFYPKRGKFFRSELEQFLLMTREQKLDPHNVKGSYAGAMGIPQFISSSYRNYAVDFDGDGRIDIWNNPADAVGSVANYFRVHGWQRGGKVTVPATVQGKKYTRVLSDDLEPHMRAVELPDYGIFPEQPVEGDLMTKLLELESSDGREYWLGFKNFYVITRYNHSALYAMAVYQLSQAIREQYREKLAGNDYK